jgi:hypothetical protein
LCSVKFAAVELVFAFICRSYLTVGVHVVVSPTTGAWFQIFCFTPLIDPTPSRVTSSIATLFDKTTDLTALAPAPGRAAAAATSIGNAIDRSQSLVLF